MTAPHTARNSAMIAARASGETLQSIADRYGLTRERVRQITADWVSAEDARAVVREARRDYWTASRILEAVREHGSMAKAARKIGVCERYLRAIVAADPDAAAELRRIARAAVLSGAVKRQMPDREVIAQSAYNLRAEGLDWEKVGERIGKYAAEARRLANLIGPDPLGRQKPYYPRGRASAQSEANP